MAAFGQKKWYGMSVNGVDSINDVVKSLTDLASVDWTSEEGREKGRKRIGKAALSISQVLGIPTSNAKKIGEAAYNWTVDIVNGTVFESGVDWLTDAKQKSYEEAELKDLGISEHEFARMIREAKGDGNMNQEKAGLYLSDKVKSGDLTQEEAEAVFSAMTSASKTFSEWQGDNSFIVEADEDTRDEYKEFSSNVSLYSDKKEQAYSRYTETVAPLGVDLETYMDIINSADVAGNGNNSVTQDEMGIALQDAEKNGSLTHEQASAIWATIWYGSSRTVTYEKWLSKNS